MEEDLIQLLLDAAGVSAVVAARISWGKPPPGEPLPRIVLHRIDGSEGYTYRSRDGLEWMLVQIDCWASDWLAAKQLGRAVIVALPETPASPFKGFFVQGQRDSNETADGATGAATPSDFFRTSLDVQVWRTAA